MLPFETLVRAGFSLWSALPRVPSPAFESWFLLGLYLFSVCTGAVLILDRIEDGRSR